MRLSPGTTYWSAYRAALRSRPDLVVRLRSLQHDLPGLEEVSALRVLDAIVWTCGSIGSAAIAAWAHG